MGAFSLSVCPWGLAKLKMQSGNCLTLFLCLCLCLSHSHTHTHNLGSSSVKVEQMLSLRVSQSVNQTERQAGMAMFLMVDSAM